MKNIIKLIILILAIFPVNNANSQSIKANILIMPKKVFPGGGKLYIEPLQSTNGKFTDFGIFIAESIKQNFKKAELIEKEIKASGHLYNPWLTTKFYDIVDSKNQADIVLSGKYTIATQQNKSTFLHSDTTFAYDNGTANKKPIIYYYYEYQEKGKVYVDGQIIAKQKNQVIDEYNFSDSLKNTVHSFLKRSKKSGIDSLVKKMSESIANDAKDMYCPRFWIQKYSFKNVKTKNKAYKDELKSKMKVVKANLKSGNLNAAAKIYLEVEKQEANENLYYNIGLCYELIGNITKATEYYEKAGSKSGIKRINKLIKTKNTLQSLGIPIVEKDFNF